MSFQGKKISEGEPAVKFWEGVCVAWQKLSGFFPGVCLNVTFSSLYVCVLHV